MRRAPRTPRLPARIVGDMERYSGVDYLELERLLTDDEKLVRDAARAFVEREIEPIVVDAFRNERFPAQIISGLAELGFMSHYAPG